jgi:hypothetical protein
MRSVLAVQGKTLRNTLDKLINEALESYSDAEVANMVAKAAGKINRQLAVQEILGQGTAQLTQHSKAVPAG